MATQSLAAQAGALAERPFQLPSVFSAPQAPLQGRKWPPYITFAHPKRSDEWRKIEGKLGQVLEGDMYFVNGDDVRRLETAKLGWVIGFQYWAETKQPSGDLIRASTVEQPKPFQEHIEAIVLCYLDDRVLPANMHFKTTRCPAAKTLSDALLDCQKPTWGQQSGAHEATLVLNQPFCRFYGDVILQAARTSKESGYTYRPTSASVHPTGVAEWALLQALAADPDAKQLMDAAAARYESNIAEVKAKLA